MENKSNFYVCKGNKKIGKPYNSYEEAAGFLKFLVMCKPFEFDYNIKEFKKVTLKKVVKNNGRI
jgi:hypothetical protein